jgi:hypothetical protein
MDPTGAILGGVSAVAGIAGGIFGDKKAEKAARKQHKYNTANWQYSYEEATRDYDWRVNENKILRSNDENRSRYTDQTALNDYRNSLAIREFDYANQMRQYQQSERIYGMQLGFNNQAAQVAYEAENRRFQETLTGMAFEQQDMLVQMLQQEGELQASGVSGRSSGKALASALASYGRNQAVMAESLVSADKETRATRRGIATDKYSADLGAFSKRMLEPMKAPAPMAPLKSPRLTITDPRKPVQGPRPLKYASGSATSSVLNSVSSGLAAVAQFFPTKTP